MLLVASCHDSRAYLTMTLSAGWLAGWLAGRLAGWLAGWLLPAAAGRGQPASCCRLLPAAAAAGCCNCCRCCCCCSCWLLLAAAGCWLLLAPGSWLLAAGASPTRARLCHSHGLSLPVLSLLPTSTNLAGAAAVFLSNPCRRQVAPQRCSPL